MLIEATANHVPGLLMRALRPFARRAANIQYIIASLAPIMSIPVILLMIIAVAAVFVALAARFRIAAMSERKSALEQELVAAKGDLSLKQTEIFSLLTARAGLEATLASEREATKEKLQLLSEARTELENSFQALANSALQKNNANFLDLARTTLEKYQTQAKGELEAREKAVETLIKPIAESLKQVDEQVRGLEKTRARGLRRADVPGGIVARYPESSPDRDRQPGQGAARAASARTMGRAAASPRHRDRRHARLL